VVALLCAGSANSLVGCNTLFYGVGFKEAETPPQLVANPKNPAEVIWNDARLFGPVPRDKATEGAALCSTMNSSTTSFKAVGYHHAALAFDGSRLPAGGFYCVKR